MLSVVQFVVVTQRAVVSLSGSNIDSSWHEVLPTSFVIISRQRFASFVGLTINRVRCDCIIAVYLDLEVIPLN